MSDVKPKGCDCGFPVMMMRNGIGHAFTCALADELLVSQGRTNPLKWMTSELAKKIQKLESGK